MKLSKENKKSSKKTSKESSGSFDFEVFQQEVVSGLQQGKSLLGNEGLLKPLIARFVERALDAELESHLEREGEDSEAKPNNRNGRQEKKNRSEAGETTISYSRDRRGTFEPITVGKRQHELGVGFDAQILELYAMSNSQSDIRHHLEKMYGAKMSESRISHVFPKIQKKANQ